MDEFLQGELVTTLRSDMRMLESFFEVFENVKDWTLVKNTPKIKTWSKKEPGMGFITQGFQVFCWLEKG